MKESEFNDYLKQQLKDQVFKEEWDALEPEFSMVQAMIDMQKTPFLTQK